MTQRGLLKLWHAWLAGSYVVAYATASEDTYAMHVFAGYAVLAAIITRLLAGILAPSSGLWRLPRPDLKAARAWLSNRRGRHPLFAWLALALLITIGAAAFTGMLADAATWMEDPHEALSEVSLWVILGHVTFVSYIYGGKRLLGRIAARRPSPFLPSAILLAALPGLAMAGDPARDALLSNYAAQARKADPGFTGFSAQRGETLFRTKWAGGDERTPSCTACHTDDPAKPGRNAKTGRPMDPVAVSVNPKRFTDWDEVEKQFGRDCKSVTGKECSAQQKGDYITFMAGR